METAIAIKGLQRAYKLYHTEGARAQHYSKFWALFGYITGGAYLGISRKITLVPTE